VDDGLGLDPDDVTIMVTRRLGEHLRPGQRATSQHDRVVVSCVMEQRAGGVRVSGLPPGQTQSESLAVTLGELLAALGAIPGAGDHEHAGARTAHRSP
jgi:aminoglycoside phosphotransferase (APT) family kinase protein